MPATVTLQCWTDEDRAIDHATGDDWSIEDGALTVYDTEGQALAAYASGQWSHVTVTPAEDGAA